MRWIACCLLAAGMGLGISAMLIKHLASKPSDPNLAELGLATDLSELAAPVDPEPVSQSVSSPGHVSASSELIDLFAKPLNPVNQQQPALIDQEVKPTAYVDPAGVVELDSLEYQWMPLCREPDGGLSRDGPDRMPRCDEMNPPQSHAPENKRR